MLRDVLPNAETSPFTSSAGRSTAPASFGARPGTGRGALRVRDLTAMTPNIEQEDTPE